MSEYVSEAVDPLPSSEPVVTEEAPVEEAVVAPSTEEVVQEVVQEISTSDNVDNSKVNELEERVKVLEEGYDKLLKYLRYSFSYEG